MPSESESGRYERALRAELETALAVLDPSDAHVVRLYFGLPDGSPLTLEEIGRTMGASVEEVREMKDRAMRSLRSQGPPPAA